MYTYRSPAKLNLFLRVLGKRKDGYHELASLFQAIDLMDRLHVRLAGGDSFSCSDPSLPMDGSNLVLRALDLFRQKTGERHPVEIHLEKCIPFQSGLGGGSSNAATLLFALNDLTGRIASLEKLAIWSQEIGSDIPFFFSRGSAYCTGRGEIMRELPGPSPTEIALFKPKEGLSTPKVFGCFNPALAEKRDPEVCLSNFLNGKPVYFNDLEAPAFCIMPSLICFKQDLLNRGFTLAQMSGSGTAFFCLGKGNCDFSEEVFYSSARFINRKNEDWF